MHQLPQWYQRAKFGILIHWGLPSIPAFAPADGGSMADVVRDSGWKHYFVHNPYAEWYQNSLRLDGSPARAYHVQRFNRTFPYQRLATRFKADMENLDTDEWASLFAEVGARYVVLVAKHHDGFPLWPSEIPPREDDYAVSRDIVGDLAHAVRLRGMHYGIYYSGLLDWTWQKEAIRDFADLTLVKTEPDYDAYVLAHYRELIDRYRPDYLWNDIGLPSGVSRRKILTHFRSTVPDGLTNNRWFQTSAGLRRLLSSQRIREYFGEAARRTIVAGRTVGRHGDVASIEYPITTKKRSAPWEAVRSIGNSFCYNEQEGVDNYLTGPELIHLLIDVVSKNGNLLLNVGPMSDGTIPDAQRNPLLELGDWLRVHGEAIYGTHPWYRAEGTTTEDIAVRYTARDDAVYAILLGRPASLSVTINGFDTKRVPRPTGRRGGREFTVRVLGAEQPVECRANDRDIVVNLPGSVLESRAVVIRFGWEPTTVPGQTSNFYTDLI